MYKFKISYQKGGNALTNFGNMFKTVENKVKSEQLQTLKVKEKLNNAKMELKKLNEKDSKFDSVKTKEDIETLEKEISTTTDQLKEKDAQLKTLGAEISTTKIQLKEKDAQLKTLNYSLNENSKLKEQIKSITNKIIELEKKLALEEKEDESAQEAMTMQTEVQEDQKKIDEKQKKVKEIINNLS